MEKRYTREFTEEQLIELLYALNDDQKYKNRNSDGRYSYWVDGEYYRRVLSYWIDYYLITHRAELNIDIHVGMGDGDCFCITI